MSEFSIPSHSRSSTVRRNLLRWFDTARRDLPWRRDTDPYRVWVSEIMLQQTKVDQALPYYNRFMDAFPDLSTLAAQDQDAVLKHWEGLGYYSRARNLHAAARLVCEQHQGYLPQTSAQLQTLPGIGRYTAGAIASISFDEVTPAIDGNVVRVYSRVFALPVDARDASARRKLEPLAARLVDRRRPGDFNQSVMELGATICTPTNPRCNECPLSRCCDARRQGRIDDYPVRVKRKTTPLVAQLAIVAIDESGSIAFQKRSTDGMLGGLWQLPIFDLPASECTAETAVAIANDSGLYTSRKGIEPLGKVRHAYSHFKVEVNAFQVSIVQPVDGDDGPETRWLPIDRVDELAITGVTKRVLGLLES